MPGNTFGQIFRITTWGESHGAGLGVVVDGCPAGIELCKDDFAYDLARRRPGQSRVTTQRKEQDEVEILSGIFEGRTTGTPIAMEVRNTDVDSSKYDKIRHVYRPGHADFTYTAKFGIRDHRGGGRSSARETVSRILGGVIGKKIIARRGMRVIGYTTRIGHLEAKTFDESVIEQNLVRCADALAAQEMEQLILACRKQGDSVGGIAEVIVRGMVAGLGEPVFNKLDADIAAALMSIGAVRGVEFGSGFAVAGMRGSESNDAMRMEGDQVRTLTNHSGGVVGGISNGADLVVRIAVKPTSSIAQSQQTVDVSGDNSTILVEGRHDPAICPRIVPVAEAMVALVLADHLLRQQSARIQHLDATASDAAARQTP